MSNRPTSFHDFKWACGHTGPGYCHICHDEQRKSATLEIEQLQKKNKEYTDMLKIERGLVDENKRLADQLDLLTTALESISALTDPHTSAGRVIAAKALQTKDSVPVWHSNLPENGTAPRLPLTHESVDAFWRVWNEVGEPHKHGVYESTWMAFRAAMESFGKDQSVPDKGEWTMSKDKRIDNLEREIRNMMTHIQWYCGKSGGCTKDDLMKANDRAGNVLLHQSR